MRLRLRLKVHGMSLRDTFRFVWLREIAALTAMACAAVSLNSQPQRQTPPRPVLVELFTSEGCSDCPPADALLARLDAVQPVLGAHVIVLSEHVTYWDQQGWRDPFSLQAVTDRQRDYGDRFKLDSIYTPQAVVDGATQFVGSDPRAMVKAIQQEVPTPAVEIAIDGATANGGAVQFQVHAGGATPNAILHDAVLIAVLADDKAETRVLRGENGGKTLQHVAVVRTLQTLRKDAFDGRTLTIKLPDSDKPGGALRLVVFASDKRTGHVLGAAEQTLAR